ncbi:radical SAM protein (plasmid) [Streptomyces alboflavus]|uniref:7-carboxy-7-deazaguanine synthase n=1 Tax=Streptomyces alboflavus TaxID=67267 RepID=A0A291W4N4_9ACTN|nr:7-carboxy-7-deazaguanine synthase QueE [Streptomyces alboflavus]ATM24616.1 radical SAM protein [Streptomyces alboflavus]
MDETEQKHFDRERELIVSEVFGDTQPTFQGEGPSMGVPALFIRLAQCNLTCTWCDTKYTWDWSRYDIKKETRRRSVDELIAWVLGCDTELVVITGGEPLLQQGVIRLVSGLLAGGKRVEIETNGTIAPDPRLLVDGVRFNVSPKLANSGVAEGKRIVPNALAAFAASGHARFKFVTRSVAELDEIQQLVDRFQLSPVYVMPEGTTAEVQIQTTRALADAVAARKWHLTQRLHILAFADARGR